MRSTILILLLAIALGQAASAAYPVVLSVTSDHAWMVADNQDTAIINVTVTSGTGDTAGMPLPNANVSLSVNTPWQLKDSFLLTNGNGIATTTLKATKVSGTANITVTAWALIYSDVLGYQNFSVAQNLGQGIDHITPSSITLYYNGQVQVRTPTPISVLIRDKWGNPVDNRNVAEAVNFIAASTGASGFQSGTSWVKSVMVPVNDSGYATVQYLVDPPGTNYISILPPSPVAPKLISITGLSQGIPFSVSTVVSPGGAPYPYTTVNSGTFKIAYTFYDRFGYPTVNTPVNITTNVTGESATLTTNSNGMVVISYGPKSIAGVYTINATAAKNLSVFRSTKVEFVSGAATDALLTASPQTMASRDVLDTITSTVNMKVVDQKGNPVSGELVNFRLTSPSVISLFNQTMRPVLENGTAGTNATGLNIAGISDENGDATVTFHPGAFTTDISDPKYNASASGSIVVQAQWTTVTRQVTLRYLNSRYLTIESWVSPSTVQVNGTVDVTVLVKGDGWALQPKPIDVLLITDRSGSMTDDLPDREVSVMGASNLFARQLDYSKDRLGLVTFGSSGTQDVTSGTNGASPNTGTDTDSGDDAAYGSANYPASPRTYSDNATMDLGLSNVVGSITNQINRTVPGGWTPLRLALYTAINGTKNKWNPNSVRALIVLSDGDYNFYGDPLARSSSKSIPSLSTDSYSALTSSWYSFPGLNSSFQNMTTFARAYNIRIYTIGFAQTISAGGKANLSALATLTGGKYYDATAASLAGVYTDIAGSLKTTAGVNTSMNLAFRNINVTFDNVTSTRAGNQVFNYTYINGHSTSIDSGNATFIHFPGYPRYFDNTSQWMSAQGFTFNIGTINLGQVWQSTITLRVLQPGTISVFDPASNVTTQDATTSQTTPLVIPGAYIIVLPNNTASALQGAAQLHIQDLNLTDPDSTTKADLGWNLSYNGLYPISEELMIASYGTTMWNHLPQQQVSNLTPIYDTGSIPTSGLAYGSYTIHLDVSAYDANSDSRELQIRVNETGVWPDNDPVVGVGATPAPRPQIKIS
jgi:hypothetical protein